MTTGHRLCLKEFHVSTLCPVVICPYLCTSDESSETRESPCPASMLMHVQSALQYKLTRAARRCVRGGARSCRVRQTIVWQRGNLHWSCIARRPCIVRSCSEYPWYCSAPCTFKPRRKGPKQVVALSEEHQKRSRGRCSYMLPVSGGTTCLTLLV